MEGGNQQLPLDDDDDDRETTTGCNFMARLMPVVDPRRRSNSAGRHKTKQDLTVQPKATNHSLQDDFVVLTSVSDNDQATPNNSEYPISSSSSEEGSDELDAATLTGKIQQFERDIEKYEDMIEKRYREEWLVGKPRSVVDKIVSRSRQVRDLAMHNEMLNARLKHMHHKP